MEKTTNDESFLEPDEEDKVEAIKLLSAWQSAIGSLSTTRVNSSSEISLSLSQSIEEDLPLLAIDLDQFQFQFQSTSSDINTIRMLWSILRHGEEELDTYELTLSHEEEQKRAQIPERTIKKGSSNLLTPSSSSSSPMAVLFTTTSTSDFVRTPVELISTLFSSIDEEEDCFTLWNEITEQFFGNHAAFHTTTLTLSVDVQAWARVKQSSSSSSSSSSLRLAVFPYPSIPLIKSMWSTLTHSLEHSPSEIYKETNEFVQKRIVVLDVLRGLIESSHRCINMKAVLWKEVQRLAQIAGETSDRREEEKEEDISRSWQLLPLTSITSHPLIKILVLVLDRTPFENIEDDGDRDDEVFSQQQPREIAAANILHAAAIAIASKNKSITIKEEEEIPIASWCKISAHIAADCLDMFCSAYNGLFTSPITTTTSSTYAYQDEEEEEEEEEVKNTTVKAKSSNSNSIPPPPLPMFNHDEEEDEEDEVISAMKKGIFAVRFPRFSDHTVSDTASDNKRLGQEGLEHDTTVSSTPSRVVFSNADVSDALLDKALGIKANETQTYSRSPPIPPSTQEERISYVRGSVTTTTSVGVSSTSGTSGTKGSVSRGMPQSTLSRKKATSMQKIEVEEN
jgi:hypothetical protein